MCVLLVWTRVSILQFRLYGKQAQSHERKNGISADKRDWQIFCYSTVWPSRLNSLPNACYLADNSIFLRVKSERHPSHFSSGSFEGGKNVRKKREGGFDFVNLRRRVLVSTLQLSGVKQKQD
jgi:hypothetical protein